MSSAPTAEDIARDATWLAQALDPSQGMARLVAMNRETYRQASFLDDRMLQAPVDAQIVPWTEIEAAVATSMRSDARWIFHIGHVGSTLISRLLGEIEGVLAVREPRLLRDLALMPAEIRDRYAAPVPKLISRTFAERDVACVKATSFASDIAPQLVPPAERALFVFVGARNYVATILAGENSLEELRILAGKRAQRLNGRGIFIPAQNDADLAAAAWAAEMASLEAAAEEMADRQLAWTNFDAMLDDVEAELASIVDLFGLTVSSDELRQIASGPLMSRYSKALEYDYSPALRRELIAGSIERYGREIDGALAMLERTAEKSPLIARALARAES